MIQYFVRVRTKEQLQTALRWGNASVLMLDGEAASLLEEDLAFFWTKEAPKVVICLPDVLRQSRLELTKSALSRILPLLPSSAGLLIRNLDELGMVRDMGFPGWLIADSFLYAANSDAFRFYLDLFPEMWFISSDELTDRELAQSRKPVPAERMIVKVYGHQPLMISNQCLNRNYTDCKEKLTSFTDSKNGQFFVMSSCRQCYSTIYNGKCTWLLDKVTADGYLEYDNLLLDFTAEDSGQMQEVLSLCGRTGPEATGKRINVPDFTRGHHYKGVE